jgi:hypothetical protein
MITAASNELKIVVRIVTDGVKKGVNEVKGQMESLKKSVTGTSATVSSSLRKVEQPLVSTADSADKATSAFRAFGVGGSSAANSVMLALGKISPNFNALREGIATVGNSMKDLGKTSKLAIAAIGAGIAAVAVYAVAKIAKSIYTKMADLVAFAAPDEYAKATKGMTESLNKLKTALGTALVPLFAQITNVIKVVADALTWFTEKVIAPYWGFISGLFGWMDAFDVSGVSSVSDEMSSAAESTGEMADDVKEMGKGLASFDKLTTQSASSSSSVEDETTEAGTVEAYTTIKDAMKSASRYGKDVRKSIENVVNYILDLKRGFNEWVNSIPSKLGAIWSDITANVGSIWSVITAGASNAWSALSSTVSAVVSSITSIATDVVNRIKSKLTGIFDGIKEAFAGAISGLGEMFAGVFTLDWSRAFDGLKEAFKAVLNGVIDLWNSAIPNVRIGFEAFGSWYGIDTNGLKLKRLEGLANGGVIEPNNPMPVIVGDNTREKEAIAPISTLQTMIDQSVQSAMARYGESATRQDITLSIDGRKLARLTHNYNTLESRRRGATIGRSV